MKRTRRIPERLTTEQWMVASPHLSVERKTATGYYPLHWHEFYEMEFVLRGNAVQLWNGVRCDIRAGSFYLLTPSDFHEVNIPEGESVELYNVKFSEAMIGGELRDRLLHTERTPLAATGGTFAALSVSFERLFGEWTGTAAYRQLAVRHALELLLIDWLRMTEATGRERARADSGGKPAVAAGEETELPGAMLREAIAYVQQEFREPVTLTEAARRCGLSPAYFSATFHQATGVPFSAYVQNVRLQFARSLLSSSALSVTDVCYASGFRSLSHFLRSFKAKFGQTPAAYRKISDTNHT
ncbi:helix-turn-helix transcriptional regulator [Paenibacillus cymbidii]|uniref:helix-turn-helix transcriptional regulator n=1 Tax=Paenibacillus cymbidii TaxID=1639034 RepID=UPI001082031F|nr:AraC family transcriptional regulator [Paenibacillus cymbidii]